MYGGKMYDAYTSDTTTSQAGQSTMKCCTDSISMYHGYVIDIDAGHMIVVDNTYFSRSEEAVRMIMAVDLDHAMADESRDYNIEDFDFIVTYVGSVRKNLS